MKKSLKSNYIYNLLYQLLIMFLPLIITPYLSRTLGASNIGIYGFTTSILSYFILFGCLGINTYGQREIAFCQDDKEKRSKIFWELILLKSIMLLISFIVFAFIYFKDVQYGIYYKILSIELFSNILDITWFYQGVEDFKKITIRNTILRLISLIAIFIFVKNADDLIKYFFIYCISNFLGYLILWLNIKKYVIGVKIKSLKIFKHLKTTISLFIPQIAIQVYTVLDKTMLGLILNDMTEVGYYEQSQKLVRMCLMLVTALGTVMIPRIANLYSKGKVNELNEKIYQVFNVVSFIAFPICLGLIGFSANFVPWFFGEGFLPVITLICIFSFLLIAIGFNNITGVQYLIPTKKQNVFTISVILGAVVNFILNLILIPIFKGDGAAISTVIAEFCILGYQMFYLRKTFDFKIIFKQNIKYLFISIPMSIAVYFIGVVLPGGVITTFIQIVLGSLIYLMFLFIVKDKLFNDILSFIKLNLKKVIKK